MRRLLLLLFALPGWAQSTYTFDGPAELPRSTVTTTYPSIAGYTTVTPAGNTGALQAAINTAAGVCATRIVTAIATYGPITLPAASCGAQPIIIESVNVSSLPAAGTRVDPTYAAQMPVIQSTNGTEPVVCQSSAKGYRLVGIKFSVITTDVSGSMVDCSNGETTVASEPANIILDRTYFTSAQNVTARHGFSMGGPNMAIIDSYVEAIKDDGTDAQCIFIYNSPGPLDVERNYLECNSEGFISGGQDPQVKFMIPTDVTVKNNYFYKPFSWHSTEPTYDATRNWGNEVKNGIEVKNAQRYLIEGNIIANSWNTAQHGSGFLITPRNQGGNCIWCKVYDVTLRYNLFIHHGRAVDISGGDNSPGGGGYSEGAARISMHDNAWLDISKAVGTEASNEDGWGFTFIGNSPTNRSSVAQDNHDLSINHNTFFTQVSLAFADNGSWSPTPRPFTRSPMTNNLAPFGTYGFLASGYSGGDASLANVLTTPSDFNHNVMNNITGAGDSTANWTNNVGCPTTCFPNPSGTTWGTVKLLNETNCLSPIWDVAGCALDPTSVYHNSGTDSKDYGADIATLLTKITGVTHLWQVTSVSPSTVSHLGGTTLTVMVKNYTTQNGARPTVSINGQSCPVTLTYDAQRLTCVAPGVAVGTYNVVVTNNGETATLTNGITFN